MNYLKIKNTGEIQPESLTLLGASTKKNDSTKIGFFGSGNKFALSYLLRNNFEVTLYSGLNLIKIDTVTTKFRDQEFKVITINGKETSITDSFGAKWELWQAMREIYSNAKDEGNASIELVSNIGPVKNETHYYIKVRPEITNWLGNFDDYFAQNKKVLFENEHGRILANHGNNANIYRKGISVYQSREKSLYDYDFNDIQITEDRIVKYSWKIAEKIWKLIYTCTDVNIIKNVLDNSSKSFLEGNIETYSDISTAEISKEFIETLKKLRLCSKAMVGYLNEEEVLSTTILPHKVFESLNHLLDDDNRGESFKVGLDGKMYRQKPLTPLYKDTLRKAKEFLKETTYEEILKYPIVLGLFSEKKILGYADHKNQQVVISDIGFEKGVNTLIEIIIEEYIHLKYNVQDCTRAFQNAAIQELVTVLKKKNAYSL